MNRRLNLIIKYLGDLVGIRFSSRFPGPPLRPLPIEVRGLGLVAGAFILFHQMVWAKPDPQLPSNLLSSLARFRQSEGGQVDLKKHSQNNLIGKVTEAEGRLFFRVGKFRLEIEKPEPSTLVMDGAVIWYEASFSRDVGGKVIVNKIKAKSLKKSQTLWTALLNDGEALKSFKLIEQKVEGARRIFRLRPKHESEIQELKVVTALKEKRVLEVHYSDDRENEVRFELSEIKPLAKGTKFKYAPPPGAEVIEL